MVVVVLPAMSSMLSVIGQGLGSRYLVAPQIVFNLFTLQIQKSLIPVIVRFGFWQNGFSVDFYFGAAGFFADFVAGFSSSVLWEKVPRKILQEIPVKILQILYNKNPWHVSAEGSGQVIVIAQNS